MVYLVEMYHQNSFFLLNMINSQQAITQDAITLFAKNTKTNKTPNIKL